MSLKDGAHSEQQRMILTAVTDALRRLEPQREQIMKEIYKDKQFPHELWRTMADVGVMGCLVPEEHGGNGLGLLCMATALEEMCAQGFANALMVVTAMDTACILRNGSDELKQRFLPDIASGKTIFCFAITEPDAGSNAFRIAMRAESNGSSYRLTGQKVFITGADVADYMLVVARTTAFERLKERGMSKSLGLSLFIVERNAKGLEMRPIPTRGISRGTMILRIFNQDGEKGLPRLIEIPMIHVGDPLHHQGLNDERPVGLLPDLYEPGKHCQSYYYEGGHIFLLHPFPPSGRGRPFFKFPE